MPDRELNREPSNRSPTYVHHFVPLHQGGRVPLPISNGTQGVMVFGSRIEVEPTFITLSPFIKGDAFRLVQANGTQGVLVFGSRTEVRPTFITLSPFTKGNAFRLVQANGTQGVLVFASRTEVPPTTPVDNLQERKEARRFYLPLYPPQRGGH